VKRDHKFNVSVEAALRKIRRSNQRGVVIRYVCFAMKTLVYANFKAASVWGKSSIIFPVDPVCGFGLD